MSLRHQSRLVRASALALLLWTVVDLAAPGLCAAEQEHARAGAIGAGDDGMSAESPSDAPEPVPAVPHVDDCFCCSHCVDVWRLIVVDAITVPTEKVFLQDDRPSDGVAASPFRPPLV